MTRISQLLEVLGPGIASLAHVGADDPDVRSLAIREEREALRTTPNGLLVAVGVRPAGEGWNALLQEAEAAGFAGVAVKAYGDAIEPASTGSGRPAVLTVAAELSWDRFITAISTIIGHGQPLPIEQGGLSDLFTLMNTIAASTGGAAAFCDSTGHTLAYSTIRGQRVDETRRQSILSLNLEQDEKLRAERQLVNKSAGVVEVPARDSDLARLAVAVRAGREVLGALWVVDHNLPARDLAKQRLAEAAEVAAIHMLRTRTETAGLYRRRGALLATLLSGSGTAWEVAKGLGLAPSSKVQVVALTLAEIPSTAQPAAAVEQVFELITLYSRGEMGFSATTAIDETVYMLLPHRSRAQQLRLLTELGDNIYRAYGYHLLIGVGHVVENLADAAQSRDRADRSVRVIRLGRRQQEEICDQPASEVVFSDEVNAQLALLRIAETNRIVEPQTFHMIAEINRYDQANDTEYLRTLSAYLQCFGEISTAARMLHIHTNTCRYRLTRLTERFNINLSDPDTRLVTALQLRVDELAPLAVTALPADERLGH